MPFRGSKAGIVDAGKKALNHIGVEVGNQQVGTYPLEVAGLALHPSYSLERPEPGVLRPSGV